MQHFILCGLGKVGWRVLECLQSAGAAVVVIDDRCPANHPRLGGARLVKGDCRQPEQLLEAGLHEARVVLVVTSDDLVSLSTTLQIRQLHPTIRIVVRLFNPSLLARLGKIAGNTQTLSTSALAAPLLALIARTGEALGAVGMAHGGDLHISDVHLAEDSPLIGQRLADLAAMHEVAIFVHQPARQAARFINEVDQEARLASHDRVVVCGTPEKVAEFHATGENESAPELLWAHVSKRIYRVLARSFLLVDWPVKVCTALFVGVILFSVLVFHVGMKNDTLIDAFYRTISLIATGADMRGADVEPGSWQKFFISFLRVFGVALMAAFTAIFTNYLIRANLGGALEVRRIPESGHYIVCGLGNVGFRVVEDLLHHGEQVVVIESNPSSSFISTARRLGAAVIIGNGTIPEVLRQANAVSARAVIAATSNDLVNLEVALLVRELAPKTRIVLRLIDTELARTLRQSAQIRSAVSIPELAAPAFVAAAFGDQVRCLFQVEGRSLVVYDMILEPGDLLMNSAPLPNLATQYRFVPLSLVASDGSAKPLDVAERSPGDRLTIMVPLDQMQQLLGR